MNTIFESLRFTDSYWIILLPAVLMALDIVTGFVNAWVKKKVKSSIMRKGLGKKIGELIVLIIAQVLFYSVSLPQIVVAGISFYIVVMELISICENLKKLGVPIPDFIDRALNSAADEYSKGGVSDNDKHADA